MSVANDVSEPLIQLRGVSRSFQSPQGMFRALKDIDLAVAKGEVFGVIGRSGAGKSTLLRTINLLERPDAGHVIFEGRDITRLDGDLLMRFRQRVSMVFQHFNLLKSKTVAQNVRLPLRIAGTLSDAEQRVRVDEVLSLVGIADQAEKYPGKLSGGQQQRVGIARALANHPDVLLCDEATSALDPETTLAILRLLLEINQRLHLTLVLITHSMEVIRTLADRVAVLDHGSIVETGTVAQVFLHPQHAVTKTLLLESGIESDTSAAISAVGNGHVIRLTYQGGSANSQLTQLSRQFGLDFALLKGSVGRLKDVPYGQFTIELEPIDDTRFAAFLAAGKAQSIHCEVLR